MRPVKLALTLLLFSLLPVDQKYASTIVIIEQIFHSSSQNNFGFNFNRYILRT